jgi:diguanylate cyclase (GGDEF)-like protein
MRKRSSWIFLVFSAVFFLFLIGLTGYRIETVREGNAGRGGPETAAWPDRLLFLGAQTGGFQTAAFAKAVREETAKQPRVLLLCLRSPEGEILYLTARNHSYLKRPDRITSDWRGTPEYAVRPGFQEGFAYPLKYDGKTLILDGLYLTLAKEDLYPILRDDLFLCLSFLLLCGIVLLLVSAYPQTDRPAGLRSPEVPNRDFSKKTPRGPVSTKAPEAVPDASPATASAVAPDAVPDAAPDPVLDELPEMELDAAPVVAPETSKPLPCPDPEEKTFFSPGSGLVWREYFLPRLRSEIERAASFDMDLSLCFVRIDKPQSDGNLAEISAAFAETIKSSFPLRDLLFEAGDDSFSLILPDTDIDQAVAALENLRAKLTALEIAGTHHTASLGASSRGGRLIDEKSLLEEAEAALQKASSDGGNQVLGFRADPMRFREALSAIGS